MHGGEILFLKTWMHFKNLFLGDPECMVYRRAYRL